MTTKKTKTATGRTVKPHEPTPHNVPRFATTSKRLDSSKPNTSNVPKSLRRPAGHDPKWTSPGYYSIQGYTPPHRNASKLDYLRALVGSLEFDRVPTFNVKRGRAFRR